MAEIDKFEIVCRRKRGKRRIPNVISNYKVGENNAESEFDFERFNGKLNEAKDELNESKYKSDVFQSLEKCTKLLNAPRIHEILCYGLGHFSEHMNSRYQLALALMIRNHFNIELLVYDPLFFSSEIRFLESIDCQVIRENEEGKRLVKRSTLIYFPHCPKQLTNNFLFANWSPDLRNCILFSNSFSQILGSHTDAVLHSTARYIVRINPFTNEIPLVNSFKYPNIFNDSALHIFEKESLNGIPIAFWEDKEEPEYRRDDVEFITNSIVHNLRL